MEINSLELKISKVLRIGVLVAGFFLLTSWILNTIDGGSSFFVFKDYDKIDLLSQIVIAKKNNQWGILIGFFGLSLLVMLPILRVALTTVLFFVQKDYKIGFVSILVLIFLMISFLLGVNL